MQFKRLELPGSNTKWFVEAADIFTLGKISRGSALIVIQTEGEGKSFSLKLNNGRNSICKNKRF